MGDAQNLAFGENGFDTVICESVNTFVANKAQAFSEYARVIKPGGYVGLNETIWLRPPAPGVARDFTQLAREEVLTSADWEALLADSGLRDLVVRTYEISLGREAINQIRLIGLKEYLRVLYKLGVLYFMESGGRRYLKEALSIPRDTMDYIGYGLYVGRKL